MPYKTLHLLLICAFLGHYSLSAQSPLSTSDIRHAAGKGPFPIYLTLQGAFAPSKNTFRPVIEDFPSKRDTKKTWGFEANIGFVVNEQDLHLFGLPMPDISGFSLEVGYRHLWSNLSTEDNRWLHLQEEVASIRLGYRGRVLLYPITYQIQFGPTFHNFSSGRLVNFDATGTKNDQYTKNERMGKGLFEKGRNRRFPAGYDARLRLMLFDPAGTTGGLGIFFEYRRIFTHGKRDLTPLYDLLELPIPVPRKVESWDYGSFSIGFVVPLALRIL